MSASETQTWQPRVGDRVYVPQWNEVGLLCWEAPVRGSDYLVVIQRSEKAYEFGWFTVDEISPNRHAAE